jgi:mono/diheme cytochrome c family protein
MILLAAVAVSGIVEESAELAFLPRPAAPPTMKALRLLPLWLSLLAGPAAAAEPVDYLRDVKPILAKNCYACHGADKQRSGLRLDTAAGLIRGGNAGPAVVPGKSADSRVIKAVTGAEGLKLMPPREPRLTPGQVATLRAWIDGGARAPADEAPQPSTTKSDHWAFRAPLRQAVPPVKSITRAVNPIDRFVLARLEREGIAPSPEADRVTLLRRLTLDLTGLPPTPQEVDEFVKDTAAGAYERQVDRLLASPRYGERAGRWWLDQARYADSNGYSIDAARSIWPYRDWVISALNRDMPFDEFTIAQLAGDLLPGATQEQKVATGFHRNTQINQEGGIDVEQFRVESVIDRVNTTGSVWLGLTIGCCQCHDHKFDPITQREYYQLFAFLNNADEPTLELGSGAEVAQRKTARGRIAALQKQLKPLDPTSAAGEDRWEKALTTELRQLLPPDIQAILDVVENGRTPEMKEKLSQAYRKTDQVRHVLLTIGLESPLAKAANLHVGLRRIELDRQLTALKAAAPSGPTTMVLQERKAPRTTQVLLGGDFTRKGAQVVPGVPALLPPLQPAGARSVSEGQASPSFTLRAPTRLDLARWLVDPKNPLTARVIVNRLWQQYFGLGLVETDNDFGTQGTPPSHPELLDWLATEFVRRAWSLKAMHRLIVTSATYRQSSRARPDLATVDARNRLLARQARLRLEAEFVRDVALEASGLLSQKVGGPSVFPPQPDGLYRFTQIDKNWKPNVGPDRYRRGLYTHFWRSAPHPSLTVFDAPDASTACTRRNRSNTPLQALTLLNDQGQYEFARALAARVLREGGGNDGARLRHGFRLCLAREPNGHERQRLGELLARQRAEGASPDEAWVTVARVLLNLDEFITRE